MKQITIIVLATVLLFAASACWANEASHIGVCIRVARNGELLSATVPACTSTMAAKWALAAVQRAAPFPPLPEGAPDVVDLHFDVTCNCTLQPFGWSNMGFCDQIHGPNAVEKDQRFVVYQRSSMVRGQFRQF